MMSCSSSLSNDGGPQTAEGKDMDEKTYEMGGKTYIQRPLVLGQIQELIPLIEGLNIPKGADAITIAKTFGEKLNYALAIALLEKDVDEPEPEKIKNAMELLDKRSVEIAYSIGAEQILEVIEDFFECNRASSVIEKLGSMIRGVRNQISQASSSLSKSFGGSPAATSPKGTKSSGA